MRQSDEILHDAHTRRLYSARPFTIRSGRKGELAAFAHAQMVEIHILKRNPFVFKALCERLAAAPADPRDLRIRANGKEHP